MTEPFHKIPDPLPFSFCFKLDWTPFPKLPDCLSFFTCKACLILVSKRVSLSYCSHVMCTPPPPPLFFVPNKTMLNNIQRKIIMCISNYYHAAMSMLPAIDIYNNINVYII